MSPAIATRAGLLTCGYYTALFLAIGAHLPYWPVWLADWGLTDGEVAGYLGAGLVVRLVANAVLSAVADAWAVRRVMLGVCGVAAAGVFALHALADTRPELFGLTLLVTVTLSPMIPLGEALGVRASLRHGFPYAHARAVGSIAFLAMNVGLGAAIASAGPGVALWTLVVCCLAAAGFGLFHPGGGAPPGGGLDTARFREGVAMIANRRLALFALAVGLGQASHGVYYAYGSLGWAARGIGADTIGWLWAVGVLAETALMLGPGRAWVLRLGAATAIAAGGVAGVVRWGGMMFEPGVAALWPLQSLHAFTFAIAHLGAMAFVAAEIAPRLQASVQGVLVGTISGVLMAGAMFGAGAVAAAAGIPAAYGLALAMSGGSAVAALLLARLPPAGGEAAQT
jgi:PPP family 3-phenylpropionic acid transporter